MCGPKHQRRQNYAGKYNERQRDPKRKALAAGLD
jgi:hypothetical protein